MWRSRDSAHGRAGKRILLFAFAGLVIFTILFPETTSIAAQWLGIGRGTDLVFYLTSFAVMFLAALVYLKFKRLEDRLATLTTQLALSEFDRETASEQSGPTDRWSPTASFSCRPDRGHRHRSAFRQMPGRGSGEGPQPGTPASLGSA